MKKTNPRRIPCSLADVERAKRDATTEAVRYAWAIIFSVMRDKEGYGVKRLRRLWTEVEDLSDSVSQGYVNAKDLIKTLEDEAGIELR